jgi:hypothetical protein
VVFGVGRGMIGGGEIVGSGLAETGSRIQERGRGWGSRDGSGQARRSGDDRGLHEGRSSRGAVVEVDTAPFSRLTNFKVGCLPEKNSPAVKEGSEDGAGG